MTGEYRRKNPNTGDSKLNFRKNTGEKMQEHIKKIVLKLINRFGLMSNVIQKHDQRDQFDIRLTQWGFPLILHLT